MICECVKACDHVYRDQFNSKKKWEKFKEEQGKNQINFNNIHEIEFFGVSNYLPFGDIQGFIGTSEDGRKLYIVFRGTTPMVEEKRSKKFWRSIAKPFELITNVIPALKGVEHETFKKYIDEIVEKQAIEYLEPAPINDLMNSPKQSIINVYQHEINLYEELIKDEKGLDLIKKDFRNLTDNSKTKRISEDFKKKYKKLADKAKVHRWYWRRYRRQARLQIHKKIIEKRKFNSETKKNEIDFDEIIVTGHSYGGAASILCTWDIWKSYCPELIEKPPKKLRAKEGEENEYIFKNKLTCIPFANLTPGNKSFGEFLNICHPYIHRFIYGHDILARLIPSLHRFQNPGILYHIGPIRDVSFLDFKNEDHGIKSYTAEINKFVKKEKFSPNLIIDSNLLRIIEDYE
ncbi:MAG: lipase family protein [Promethearchaeota archaeon]